MTPPAAPVDVVVPTFRRPEALTRCLEALERQTVRPASIQVVDDSETDCGPAWARNQGWRRGAAPVVAFTDDDCVPEPDWVARIASAFQDPDLAALEGSILLLEDDAGTAEGPTWHPHDPLAYIRYCRFKTANMAYRRDVLEAVGGFDEGYYIHREDTDLAWRVMKLGHGIPFHPEVRVRHPERGGGERFFPESELRLYHVEPRWYAECLATALNRHGLRTGSIGRFRRALRHRPDQGLDPVRWAARLRLYVRAGRIAVGWRLRWRR